MEQRDILALCDAGKWSEADATLRQAIKATPDRAEIYGWGAHSLLRQGNAKVARWMVNKAQSITADDATARIEDICIDFYEARFETAYRKAHAALLKQAPEEHPVYLVVGYLCCLYDDRALYEQLRSKLQRKGFESISDLFSAYFFDKEASGMEWNAVEKILQWLQSGDRLLACIAARYAEIFFPSQGDSFAALGIFNLYAGFFENADRNFHEAIFRESAFAASSALPRPLRLASNLKRSAIWTSAGRDCFWRPCCVTAKMQRP